MHLNLVFCFLFFSPHPPCHLYVRCQQIDAKRDQLSDAKRELKSAKADAKVRRDEKAKKYVMGLILKPTFFFNIFFSLFLLIVLDGKAVPNKTLEPN